MNGSSTSRVHREWYGRRVRQRGVTVLEVAVSCAVLSILIGMTAAALGRVSIMRGRVADQVFARQQVENLAELIQSMPYDTLSERVEAGFSLNESAQTIIPSSTLTVELRSVESSGKPAQQIWIELRWPYAAGRPEDRVTASVLRFPTVVQETGADIAGEGDDA